MLSSSGLHDSVELLIDIDGVLNIVTCYMLHVTLRGLQFAKMGRKNWSKNST